MPRTTSPVPPDDLVTVDDWIRYANSIGLAVHNMSQMHDGRWRLSFRVFESTPSLARDPTYTDYADCDNILDCFRQVFASTRFPVWREKAKLSIEAMENGTCTATLFSDNRPETQRKRKEYLDSLADRDRLQERRKAREALA